MFKKIFLSIFSLFFLFSINAFGQEVVNASTDYIAGISLTETEVEGGSNVDVSISLKGEKPRDPDMFVEYGVARELKKGYITFFENLSREVVSVNDLKDKLVVSVPNIVKASTDTYVVYVKTYKKNDPESEHFLTSKSFSLKPGSSEFFSIKHANLLQSNTKRYNLMAGPTIYDPSEVAKNSALAKSSSLEITLESNTSATLNPIIKFSKLRTDALVPEVSVNPLEIKKGDNYFVIPLPTFDYAPGVYVGSMEFNSPLIKNTVQFQFIVAGDAVTVGQVNYSDAGENHSFTYDIFGTPVDIENVQAEDLEKKTYNVSLSYLKGKKVIFTESKSVDFDGTSFESLVPAKYKKIDSVNVVVTAQDGKVVYEGKKELGVNTKKSLSNSTISIIIALIVLVLIFVIEKIHKNKLATVNTLALLFVVLGATQVFASWIPNGGFVTGSQPTIYNRENAELLLEIGDPEKRVPKISFNENISEKVYQTGEDLIFEFKALFLLCNNVLHDISTGFSLSSISVAQTSRVRMTVDSGDGSRDFETNVGVHNFFTQTIDFGRANLGKVDTTKTHLYAHVYHNPWRTATIRGSETETTNNSPGYTNYKIPLKVAPPNPTGLNAKPSPLCGGKVDLTWDAVPTAAGYKVYRSESATSGFMEVANVTKTSHTDTADAPSTKYYYKVTAYASSGAESDLSSATSAESSSSAPCFCPDGVTPIPADGKCVCPDGSPMPADGKCSGVPTFCPDGVTPMPADGKCLCPDGVTAMPADGVCRCPDGSVMPADGVCRCPDGSVMPADGKCPGTPPSITTISSISTSCDGTTGTKNTLRFSATSSKYPVTYNIERKAKSASSFTVIGTYKQEDITDSNPAFTDSDLPFNTDYNYRVSASNSVGTGPMSNISSVNTKTKSECDLEGDGGDPKCDAEKVYDGDKCCSVKVVAGKCPDDDDGGTPGRHSFCRSKGGTCAPTGGILQLEGLLTDPLIVKSGETCKVYLRGGDTGFAAGFHAFKGLGSGTASCTLSGPGVSETFNPLNLFTVLSPSGEISYVSVPITGTTIYTLTCEDGGVLASVSATCRVAPKEVEVSFFDRVIKTSARLKDGLLGAVLFSIGAR